MRSKAGPGFRTRLFLVAAAVSAIAGASCSPSATSSGPDASEDWFVDRAVESGLDFVHYNGRTAGFYYPEAVPPGVALFDYDNDGDLDVFVVQGRVLGDGPRRPRRPPPDLRGRLFRNDSAPAASGSGVTLRFTDVTAASGIEARAYGMGAATGDFDRDGCIDLYVTNLGANQLFRNNCDGTFADVTAASGTAAPDWTVSASFVDIDRDGWLDLFVGQYMKYAVATNQQCRMLMGQLDYCGPQKYPPQPSALFRNNRDGTFRDISTSSGIDTETGKVLGVASADYTADGWMDLYVANDGLANHLWINQGNLTFRNTAVIAGAAVSPAGKAKASMGVDAGDADNDGDEDLVVGELTQEGAYFFVNDGTGVFTEASTPSGLQRITLPFTTFGAAWLDADNDGYLDIAMINGGVAHTPEQLSRHQEFELGQRRLLIRNLGNGRFEDVTAQAGSGFAGAAEVGRGAAFGDMDNDGDTDIVVGNDDGPMRLLVNQRGNRNAWVGVRLTDGNVTVTGARVAVRRSDGVTLWRRTRSDGSFASANDPRVLAGLGAAKGPVAVTVTWPDGTVEAWADIQPGRYTTLARGSSRKP